eukprot:TRINITY_DN90_c0_g1_i1.p1 TRINITY_DN90_c0_g1~~TRINITY_DN90_c0_g1_i1.p1  ORF type:complete len:577 (+),score=116.32 TRINITY_DN90_c0_g1_i1:58-1788(+)
MDNSTSVRRTGSGVMTNMNSNTNANTNTNTNSNTNTNTNSNTNSNSNSVGMHKPLSLDGPSAQDVVQSEELVGVLQELGSFESAEESQRRREVLIRLDVVLQEWVRRTYVDEGHAQELASEIRAKLCTFGSFRLGVNGPGGDIDALCVAPRHVSQEDFFADVPSLLRADPSVCDLQEVPDSYVPVIKFELMGISVDLIFVSLDYESIPDDLDLVDEDILVRISGRDRDGLLARDRDRDTRFQRAIRCLNGSRVTDTILHVVPNLHNFRTTLRFVKMWAKNRGIYGNVWGYFGGVTLAMLTAFTCQLYPNAAPNVLISRFFRVQNKWNWPKPIKIMDPPEGPLGLKNWEKKKNRADLMPIITPCYPTMNSSYTVSKSTLQVIKEEIERGHKICESALQGKEKWIQLLEPFDFFAKYNHFVEISLTASSNDELLKWSGHCTSRLRELVKAIQDEMMVALVHPYPKQFDITDEVGNPSTLIYFGLSFRKRKEGESISRVVNLSGPAIDFLARLYHSELKTPSMNMHIRPVKRHEIPREVRGKKPKSSKTKGSKRKRDDTPTAEEPSAKKEDIEIPPNDA